MPPGGEARAWASRRNIRSSGDGSAGFPLKGRGNGRRRSCGGGGEVARMGLRAGVESAVQDGWFARRHRALEGWREIFSALDPLAVSAEGNGHGREIRVAQLRAYHP